MTPPPRFNVHGVGVHALTLPLARTLIVDAAREREPRRYVCCCDAHSVDWAHRDPRHRENLRRAFLVTPDGMPLVWLGRRAGHSVGRVYGPDLLLTVCAATAGPAYSHFFYGATPGTAPLLAKTLQARFPGLNVAGTFTPPVGILPVDQRDRLEAQLQTNKPDFFWVGLSTPKQEAFMAEHAGQFDVGIMIGIGAAFDLLSGRIRQAPRWVRGSGFEWVWRLAREPRRLGPRYARSVPLFALRTLAQLSGLSRWAENPDTEPPPTKPQNKLP